MADASCQHKEVEYGMHVFFLVDTVKYSTRDVANTFCNNPPDCGWGNRIDKRLEGNENREPHANKAERLEVAVVLELGKTHDGSGNGASPDKDKKAPSPVTLFAHGYERDRGVGTGNMPIDGGMVPFAQTFLPLAPGRNGMIGGGSDV